jgi:hypothetical protein
MQPLTAHQILTVWEMGLGQHPVERALTILHASDGESLEALAGLTVAERDRRLLDAREQTFGRTLDAYVECSACAERLEFSLTTDSIRTAARPTVASGRLRIADVELGLRPPTSNDLRALRSCGNVESAHERLVELCVVEPIRDGETIAANALPGNVVAAAAARMSALDPQAEVLIDLSCPICQASEQILFDIAAFFWSEIAVRAKRLLHEIHLLARAYCWSEADILGMSPHRRECYLTMVQE